MSIWYQNTIFSMPPKFFLCQFGIRANLNPHLCCSIIKALVTPWTTLPIQSTSSQDSHHPSTPTYKKREKKRKNKNRNLLPLLPYFLLLSLPISIPTMGPLALDHIAVLLRKHAILLNGNIHKEAAHHELNKVLYRSHSLLQSIARSMPPIPLPPSSPITTASSPMSLRS